MADPLRYPGYSASDPVPDQPNMNVVPPAAPFGSADAATTAGSTSRGDFVVGEADDYLDPEYGYADRRSFTEDDAGPAHCNAMTDAFEKVRNHVGYISESLRNGSFKQELQERAEEWMDRAADLATDLQGQASSLASNARFRTAVLKDRIVERSQDVQASTQRLINQKPAQAIAVAAGVGLVVGVLLRLGRSRREY